MKNNFFFSQKNKLIVFWGSFSLFCTVLVSKSEAQVTDCGCNAALKKDLIIRSEKDAEQLYHLSTLTESEYNELKRDGSAEGNFGLIGASIDYQDFQKNITVKTRAIVIDKKIETSSSTYEYRTNPIAYAAWNKCHEACNQAGVFLWLKAESEDDMTARIKYVPGIGNPISIPIEINITHGDDTPERIKKTITNGFMNIDIHRKYPKNKCKSKTKVTINSKIGYAPESVVSMYDTCPPPPCPINQSDMVKINGGTFIMGNNKGDVDEVPEHEVYVKPFFMSKYEVTQKVWKNIMGYNHSSFGECDECPVENINYGEIEAFFGTLNGMCSGRKYRLPSEAEWEFAAKGGVYSKGFKYAGSNDANKVGWTQNNSGKKTHPVGLLQPNELGLFDMTGNVLEFCSDTFCYYPNAKIKYCDPSQQIARGGSWLGAGSVTDRGNKTRDYKDSTYGFRLVCDY